MLPRGKRKLKTKRQMRAYNHPPFHAKGIKVDGLRRSPGFASKDALQFTKQHIRICSRPSRVDPSDRLRFSRLQLRGSAGIAPASLSSPHGKDAQTERTFQRTRNTGVRNLPGGSGG